MVVADLGYSNFNIYKLVTLNSVVLRNV